jgi:WG containing repeat
MCFNRRLNRILGPTLVILFCFEVVLSSEYERNPSKPKGSDPIFRVVHNNRWGFVTREGQMVVAPKFFSVGPFFRGVARVTLEVDGKRKDGFINPRGKLVIAPEFDEAGDFREGAAPVRLSRKWGFIDPKGHFIVSPEFQGAGEFHEGLAVVQYWNQWPKSGTAFYTNETAPLSFFRLLKDNFLFESENSSLLFPDRYDSKIGFINQAGDFVIQPQDLDLADDFSDGRARVYRGGKRNFLTREGKLLCADWFDYALPFSEGLASIQMKLMWGYINTDGKVIIPPQFEFAGSFSEGLAVVSVAVYGEDGQKTRLQGAIDKTGRTVIPPSFESLSEFSEGFAVARRGRETFFVDRAGTRVQITKLPAAWGFRDGLAIAGLPGKRVYIDRSGKIVAPFEMAHE